jgi:putative addiction module killer protein
MKKVNKTNRYRNWIDALKDTVAIAKINICISRLLVGNIGSSKSVGNRVFELKIDYGPGYRVYYTEIGDEIILLLCGGDKSTQSRDIIAAKDIAKDVWTNGNY